MIAASHLWWNLTRATANVAWALLLLTMVWGVLLSTRALKSFDRPAWLRDLHTWLGGLALSFTVLHMATLIMDNYVDFTLADVLVPMSSSWKPIPVTLGIVGFYILVAVQGTSLVMNRMRRETWRGIHMLSYVLFGLVIVHALTAGSDVGNPVFTYFSVVVAMAGTMTASIRWILGRYAQRRAAARAASDRTPSDRTSVDR